MDCCNQEKHSVKPPDKSSFNIFCSRGKTGYSSTRKNIAPRISWAIENSKSIALDFVVMG
jgi:hypothetical protein